MLIPRALQILCKYHLLVSQEISQYQRSLGGDKMFYVASLQRR